MKTKTKVLEVPTKMVENNTFQWDPIKNKDVIALTHEKDGNWKAYGQKFGKLIVTREVSPEAALGRLLTHDGK